jgi:DNA-binding helix-hairpin-helix protein with protein kinase domain
MEVTEKVVAAEFLPRITCQLAVRVVNREASTRPVWPQASHDYAVRHAAELARESLLISPQHGAVLADRDVRRPPIRNVAIVPSHDCPLAQAAPAL